MPVTDQTAVIESFVLRVQLVCRQLQLVQRSVTEFDRQIAAAYAVHPDREIFASLPGAGAVLGTRLLASIGSRRERFGAAADLQRYTGIAPVTKKSGLRVTFTGVTCVPSSTSKASTNLPRKAFCGVAGRRPTRLQLTSNIGYPKLFMGCERANEKRAQQPVNNFAANRAATVSDWPLGFNFGIGSLWLPAPAGQAC